MIGRAWFQVAFACVATGLVVMLGHPDRIVAVLLSADPRWVIAGTLLWLVIQRLNIWKWALIDRAQGGTASQRELATIYYIGMFYNTFLPSGFGGDAARAYELTRQGQQAGSSVASVLVDRYASVLALIVCASIADLLAPPGLQAVPVGAIAGLDLAALGLGLVLWSGAGLDQVARWRPIARRERLAAWLVQSHEAAGTMRRAKGAAAGAFGIALGFQLLSIVEHYCFMRAMGIEAPLAYMALVYPLLSLLSSLPISINGIGLREGGFVWFLGRVGAPPAAAIAVGLLSMSMLLLSGAWGGGVLMRRSLRRARA